MKTKVRDIAKKKQSQVYSAVNMGIDICDVLLNLFYD